MSVASWMQALREVAAAAEAPTAEQLERRRHRHLRNLVLGVRGIPTVSEGWAACALCDRQILDGDEIITCEGGLLCPHAGQWPCRIHAEHREDQP